MADIPAGILTPDQMNRLLEMLDQWGRFQQLGWDRAPIKPSEGEDLLIHNADSIGMPAFGCGQVIGTVQDGGLTYLSVKRPSDTHGQSGWYVFNKWDAIAPGKKGIAEDGPHVRGIGSLSAGTRYSPTVGAWTLTEDCYGLIIGAGQDNIAPGVSRGFITWAPPDEETVNSLEELLRCGVRVKRKKIRTLKCEDEESPGDTDELINPEWCHEYPPPPYPDDDYCYDCYLGYETASSPADADWCQIGVETGSGTAVWAGCGSTPGIAPSDLDREGFPPEPECHGYRHCDGTFVCETECNTYPEDCPDTDYCLFIELSAATATPLDDTTPPLAQEGSGGGWSQVFYHSLTQTGDGSSCVGHYWNIAFCGDSRALTQYQSEIGSWRTSRPPAWSGNDGTVTCTPDALATDRALYETCADTVVLFEMPSGIPGCCDGDEETPGPGPDGQPVDGCCGSCSFAVSPTGQDQTTITGIDIIDVVTGYRYSGGNSEMLTTQLADGTWVSQCRWVVRNVTRTILGGTETATLHFVHEGGEFRVSAVHADDSTLNLGAFTEDGVRDCNGKFTGHDGASQFTISGGTFCEEQAALVLVYASFNPGLVSQVLVGTAIIDGELKNIWAWCADEETAEALTGPNGDGKHWLHPGPPGLIRNNNPLPNCR